MCVYVCMYVCVYECVYASVYGMCVCMCMCACMHVCPAAYVCVCMYVSMYACQYVRIVLSLKHRTMRCWFCFVMRCICVCPNHKIQSHTNTTRTYALYLCICRIHKQNLDLLVGGVRCVVGGPMLWWCALTTTPTNSVDHVCVLPLRIEAAHGTH